MTGERLVSVSNSLVFRRLSVENSLDGAWMEWRGKICRVWNTDRWIWKGIKGVSSAKNDTADFFY